MKLGVMGAAFAVTAAVCCAPAFAADLGGDCCSDLEERVAELEATTARKGNRRVSLEIYGQITTALMAWDNGKDSGAFVVDGATDSSRFGFTGSAKIRPGLTAGFQIEVSVLSARSDLVTEVNDDGDATGDGTVALRLANWYLADEKLGRLSVGRLKMATDGITEIDLGGANVVAKSGLYFGNAFSIINSNTGASVGPFSNFAVGNFEYDRNNAVRYDSPTLAGFQASTAWGEDERWDVALRYAGEFGGFRLAAGIAYGRDTDELAFPQERIFFGGSASILHLQTGLFLSGSAAQRERENVVGTPEETYWSVRGGIAQNWFGIGKTVLYGEYHHWVNVTDDEADIWGVGVIQNIDAAAMELFLAYKNNSVDLASGVGTEDLHLVISGARIRF